jgi:hypothetical protein
MGGMEVLLHTLLTWRWIDSYTPWLLNPRRKSSVNSLYKWLGGFRLMRWPRGETSPLSVSVLTELLWYTAQSESESRCDRRSVGQSVLVSSPIWGSWPEVKYCLTVVVFLKSGAPSDEGSGLSFVIVLQLILVRLQSIVNWWNIYNYCFKWNLCIYNIYKAPVSPGWEQQIMPYLVAQATTAA